jgi:hypothetical protein
MLDPNGLAPERASVRAAFDDHALDAHAPFGRLEPNGQAGAHAPDCELGLDADDGIMGAGHARVGDGGSPTGLHTRVRRLDVRMGSEDSRHAAVKPARQRDLLARRLCMEVDEDDLRIPLRLGDEVVHDLKESDRRAQEERAEQADHGDGRAALRNHDDEPATRCVPGQVGGPGDTVGLLQVRNELLTAPDVVSERDRVGPRGEYPFRKLRRQARAVGGVLRIDDADICAKLVPQLWQPLLDRPGARGAEDVGDEENVYGMASVAAGSTSIATWLPASCV